MPRKQNALRDRIKQQSVTRNRQKESTVSFAEARRHLQKEVNDLDYDKEKPWLARAQRLSVLYSALRQGFFGQYYRIVEPDNRLFLSFVKAAKVIRRYERDSQTTVHDLDYIMAHLHYWGKHCFISRLHSTSSMALYLAYKRQRTSKQVVLSSEEYAQYSADVLQDLAQKRGESVEQVRSLLERCELL